jgi:hypothetical protein
MLTNSDLSQIEAHGLTVDAVYRQLETFTHGIPYAHVVTAASSGNGIEIMPKPAQEKLISYYEERREDLEIVKFVPASGAATRMFKFLFRFLEDYDPEAETLNNYLKKEGNAPLREFFSNLKLFPFVNEVRKTIRENYPEYKRCNKGQRCYYFVEAMLGPNGLNFGQLPKGLIPFHRYKKYCITAFEEQLYEAAHYATAKDNAYLHFTFSEKHVDLFKQEFESIKSRVEKKTKTTFHITYSFQEKKTDTIAVTLANKPFRNDKGELVFRPSGHGALLNNLNDVDADIIFIKNIDNVVIEEYVPQIADYKKMLAGKLLWLQNKIFQYLLVLEKDEVPSQILTEIKSFLWNELSIKNIPEEKLVLAAVLNRPLRVCGVVKNTGAPGGGPFWIKNAMGQNSIQIVETAQINMEDAHQRALVNEATHFNPVDIVCGVRNYKGEKFDLSKFCDPNTGFISEKSQDGKPLKALELPGLWNGAMAKWNSAFVEVPLITFNPVKTVNDLLKVEHRPNA